jgi:hypothetical protein
MKIRGRPLPPAAALVLATLKARSHCSLWRSSCNALTVTSTSPWTLQRNALQSNVPWSISSASDPQIGHVIMCVAFFLVLFG